MPKQLPLPCQFTIKFWVIYCLVSNFWFCGCQETPQTQSDLTQNQDMSLGNHVIDHAINESTQDSEINIQIDQMIHDQSTSVLPQDLGVIDQEMIQIDQTISPPLHAPRPAPISTQELIAPTHWRWARGLIHMHSVHSHDACDGDPKPDGQPNAPCLADLRRSVCDTQLDFMLLTDHPESFADVTFTEATLHQADAGDQLIYDATDQIIGNRLKCENDREVLIAPGSEGELMPVMLERVPPERSWYRDRSATSVEGLRNAGAIVLHAHTEQRVFDEMWPLGLDGFEIYNLHANVNPRGDQLREVISDLTSLLNAGVNGPHPDLALLAILRENPRALSMWDHFIAHRETVGFAGSDIHQNLPPLFPSPDGERLDSYRRLSSWFANYLLVDELNLGGLKQAIKAGRLYVVFHLLGEPVGIDFALFDAEGVRHELGSRVELGSGLTLQFDPPQPPEGSLIQVRLLKLAIDPARPHPGEPPTREVVAESQGESIRLSIQEAGAYRVEVSLTPEHLRNELGEFAETLVRPTPWIYSNPIYVRVADQTP